MLGRPRRAAAWLGALAIGLCACGDEAEPSDPAGPAGGGGPVGCQPGELTLEGGDCLPAGVPATACAIGFSADDRGGCVPILPDGPCPTGQMAVVGETVCREIAPCGDPPWGDIPVDGTTQYVDGQATGAADGSAAAPWPTIAEAVDAAAPGALIAVAAGSYAEQVVIAGKPVQLWGRCPSLVEVTATVNEVAPTIAVQAGADGSLVRGLAISGGRGVEANSASDVTVEQIWVHDTTSSGVRVIGGATPASMTLRDSLLESTSDIGALAAGGALIVERSVVRGTQLAHGGRFGRGVSAMPHPLTAVRSTLTVSSAVVEQNHDIGIDVSGSDGVIEATVVRHTQPVLDGTTGWGIVFRHDPDTAQDASGQVIGSVVEGNHGFGVYVTGADATIETTTVRDTQSLIAERHSGDGISVQYDHRIEAPTRATIRSCTSEGNHSSGIIVVSAEATIEAALVRDTLPRELDQLFGFGITVFDNQITPLRSAVAIRGTRIERSHGVGLHVSGSDATIEGVWVSDTSPHAATQEVGRGMNIQASQETGNGASATIVSSLVERSHDGGIMVLDAQATVENTTIRATAARPLDDLFGDGLTVWSFHGDGSVAADGLTIDGNARAGVASFGGAVALAGSSIQCNAIDLAAQDFAGRPGAFQDLGSNTCGCDGADADCVAVTAELAPPEPLDLEP